MSDLQKIAGIGPARAAVLTAAGYGTPEAMAAAGQAVIADLLHINEIAAAEMIIEAIQLEMDALADEFIERAEQREVPADNTAVYEHFLTGRVKR